jgi:hypothetical protein
MIMWEDAMTVAAASAGREGTASMGELREDNTDVTLKCRHVSSQLVNGVFDHPSSNAGKLFIKQELHKAWCAGPFSARGPNPMLQDDRELCEVGGASLSLSLCPLFVRSGHPVFADTPSVGCESSRR